jgi:hypothetical protein
MAPRHVRAFCELSADCERLLERAMMQQGLTARAHDRILKVARTVADLDGAPAMEPKHIAEAIQYRTLDRTFLGLSSRVAPHTARTYTDLRLVISGTGSKSWNFMGLPLGYHAAIDTPDTHNFLDLYLVPA